MELGWGRGWSWGRGGSWTWGWCWSSVWSWGWWVEESWLVVVGGEERGAKAAGRRGHQIVFGALVNRPPRGLVHRFLSPT